MKGKDGTAGDSRTRPSLTSLLELRSLRLERSVAEFYGRQKGDLAKTLDFELGGACMANPDAAGQLRAVVQLKLSARPDEGESRKLCALEARLILDYEVSDPERLGAVDRDDPDLQTVLKMASHNAWPFLRELFYSLSSRMGIAPIVLPSLRITAEGIVIGGHAAAVEKINH